MKKNNFIEGTIISYIVILLTKILGALYVIPFYKIIGENGGILYSYAYNVYNVFLDISTSGIPIAVSIIIAEYNTLKKFNEREYTYKIANKLIFIISIISFLIMFTFSPQLAKFFVGNIENANDIYSISLVIKVISFCLLVIPFLSVTRGYLQGNKYAANSSYSQLIEQVTRIIVLLLGSYIAINLLNKSVLVGVSVALSGTVIGGLCALIYLKYKINKNKDKFLKDVDSNKKLEVTEKQTIDKIIKVAIPIVIISITQNIYNTIDLKLIIKGLYIIGYPAYKCELIGSIIITWGSKICMLINALATGMCISIIPFIVNSYVKNNIKELNFKVNQAINTILFISIPLAIYIIIFSKPVYYIFYGNSEYGTICLKVLAIVSILFTLQLVINMILQSMKKYKIVYLNTFVGVIINTILDIPMVILLYKFNFYPYIGSMVSTIISQIVSILIAIIYMKKYFKFSYKSIYNTVYKMIFPLILITILSILLNKFFFNVNEISGYIITFIKLALFGLLYLGIYLIITYKNKLIEDVFGKETLDKIMIKFKLKK